MHITIILLTFVKTIRFYENTFSCFYSPRGNCDAGLSACTQEEINQFRNSVNSIKLDQTQVEMTVGETLHLIATVDPFKGDTKVVTWTSSSPDVASVKGTEVPDVAGINMPAGEVTALKEGVFLGKVLEYSPRFFIFHPLTVAPLALEDYVLTVRNLNEANPGHSYF